MLELNLERLQIKDYHAGEAYKILRTNIRFCGDENKVIAITSCKPNEGKTTVSLNLAISISESGKRVIYIDGDLRKAGLLGGYNIGKPVKGFTHYLSGQNKSNEVIQETNIPNLHIILSGPVPPNPAELLDTKYFKTLIKDLRKEYDYVIIDTPPLGGIIDGVIIANECDGAILVVESNAILYKFAQKVKEQLSKADCNLLGAVLNKFDITKTNYYGNYYGKYDSKYYYNKEDRNTNRKKKTKDSIVIAYTDDKEGINSKKDITGKEDMNNKETGI